MVLQNSLEVNKYVNQIARQEMAMQALLTPRRLKTFPFE